MPLFDIDYIRKVQDRHIYNGIVQLTHSLLNGVILCYFAQVTYLSKLSTTRSNALLLCNNWASCF